MLVIIYMYEIKIPKFLNKLIQYGHIKNLLKSKINSIVK